MPGKIDHASDDEGKSIDAAKGIDAAGSKRDADPRPRAPEDHRDTGAALRSVYQKTVDEAVPDEMMDLLGRLD